MDRYKITVSLTIEAKDRFEAIEKAYKILANDVLDMRIEKEGKEDV